MIKISTRYGWVLISAGLASLYNIKLMTEKRTIDHNCFTPEFMSKFNALHQKHFHENVSPVGENDEGDGPYSRELSHDAWHILNSYKILYKDSYSRLAIFLPILFSIF